MNKLKTQIRETIQVCRDYDDSDEETTKRLMKVIYKWLNEYVGSCDYPLCQLKRDIDENDFSQ